MYTKRSKITDILLLILFIVIAVLLCVGGYFHYSVKKRIYEDSYFINKLGLIRGNIQRYAKFKIAGKENKKIYNVIKNTLLNVEFMAYGEKNFSTNFYKNFHSQIIEIKKEFEKLKNTNDKQKILSISEDLWKKTNFLVKTALKFHRYKFDKIIETFNMIIYATIGFLIFIIIFIFQRVKRGLEVETITDKLTTLYNRMFFNEIYEYLIARYKKNKVPFSMLIIDIDNFKKINDFYGHQKGDEILKKLGEILKTTIRKSDLPFRYGGEEFIILFPNTKLEEAHKVAQRILKKIPSEIKINNNPITISGGIGEYKGENPKEFFEKVDEALYSAKRNGKNQILKA